MQIKIFNVKINCDQLAALNIIQRKVLMNNKDSDLSAYRSVLSVCSQQLRPGDIIAI